MLKDDGDYETNNTRLKMFFNKVCKINVNEMFSWEYIDDICFKYIVFDNEEKVCFATNAEASSLYIVCDCVEYEEIN